MSAFNLPPGCRLSDIPGNSDSPCEMCGKSVASDCDCPECPICEEVGNPNCYEQGHLKVTRDQLIGQTKLRISNMEQSLTEERYYLEWLEQQPANFTP